MTLLGSDGKVQTDYFDDPDRDDFIKGANDKFVFGGLKEVGEIHCLDINVGGDDWWLWDSVSKLHYIRFRSALLTIYAAICDGVQAATGSTDHLIFVS